MAIQKELRRYSSQKSIRGLSHSSTSRPFSTRSKIKLTGARANRVTHRRSQDHQVAKATSMHRYVTTSLYSASEKEGSLQGDSGFYFIRTMVASGYWLGSKVKMSSSTPNLRWVNFMVIVVPSLLVSISRNI